LLEGGPQNSHPVAYVMRRYIALSLAVSAFAWTALQAAVPPRISPLARVAGLQAGQRAPASDASARTAIDQYCVACHNARLASGGLSLDSLDPLRPAEHGEVWEKVVRKLQTRVMPPAGARRPDEPAYRRLIESITGSLDRAAAERPDVGRIVLRRMNRSEYANAIRDLLALDIDASSLLPADDSAYGFDNNADVLGLSPSLQERYLSAAAKISALAVGDLSRGPVAETYRVRQDLSQNAHIEGLPLGTVGGLLVQHLFPVDGEYEFRIRLQQTNFGNLRGLDYPQQVETSVDGARTHIATIGGNADLEMMFEQPQKAGDAIEARLTSRVRVKGGPRDVGVAFVRNLPLADTRRLQQFLRSSVDTLDWTGLPHIQSVTITGPFGTPSPGETPSRARIFTCGLESSPRASGATPASPNAELTCARRIVQTLARRAYRAPVNDADLRPLMEFYETGRREGGFETGIQRALQALLASPRFVFRVERDPAGTAPGTVYPVPDVELASRLSFFLWSSIPDDTLLTAAAGGSLDRQPILEQQVRRMLADPRATALVANFAGQWLQLRNVKSVLPNSDEFPDFDDSLRQSMLRETELLFESIVREDRPVLDLLDADYTFVNERLARHYGIANIYGSHFRRVPVPSGARRGLLGHGSILALTSHAERTSPVVRGKWVLDNILGTPPPPPPPDVPTLADNEAGEKPRTMRERMAQHRAMPTCAACHRLMDPIGFALENFDAVGAWRTREPGGTIDATAELPDGTKIDGVAGLRAALLARPEVFVTTMTEKMLTYALGRGLTYRDMPAVRAIVEASAAREYRFSSLVTGIVSSQPFRMRMAAGGEAGGP
jgi:mono/diheme cytochrome c family protein